MRATILINNYNYGRYLGAAIDSALGQNWDDLEVVVVDDGSTDGSSSVIRSYGEAVVAVWKDNGGQSSAINAGFDASSGDVLFLLDADDWFLPEKIATVMSILEREPKLGWCFHQLRYDGRPSPASQLRRSGRETFVDVRTRLERGRSPRLPVPATSGLCLTRSLAVDILPIPEHLRVPLPGTGAGSGGTAADFYLKIAALALAPGVLLDDELAVQRVHEANAFTAGRGRGNPRRSALELEIAAALRDRWPVLRRYALRRGLGGLKRLRQAAADGTFDAAVDGFISGCTPTERMRIAVHLAWWRIRR